MAMMQVAATHSAASVLGIQVSELIDVMVRVHTG